MFRKPVTKSAIATLDSLERLIARCEEDVRKQPENSFMRGWLEGETAGLRVALRFISEEMAFVEVDAAIEPEPVLAALRERVHGAVA